MTARAKTTWQQREAFRAEWESDPKSTFQGIGRRIGLTAGAIRSHATHNGWTRTPDVITQAKAVTAARNLSNVRSAMDRGYVPSTEAAMAARLGLKPPTKAKEPRRYPSWETCKTSRTYSPPGPRYASVFHYGSMEPAE